MLKLTLDGESATLVLSNSAMTTVACFPAAWQQPNLAGLKRPPGVAGNQLVNLAEPQDGCVNSTDVPYMRRCWVDKTTLIDMVAFGADSDSLTGSTFRNNLMVYALNFSGLCRVRVDDGCLSSGKEPLVCYLAAVSSIALGPAGVSPATSLGAASAPAALAAQRGVAGVMAAEAANPPSSRLSSGQRLAVALSVSLVGGAIVVLLVAAVVVVAARRRRSRASSSSCSKPLAAASATAAGAPQLPCSATLVGARSDNAKTASKGVPVSQARLYRRKSCDGMVTTLLSSEPAPAAGEAGGSGRSGPCGRSQDCAEEEALPQNDDGEEDQAGLRIAAGDGAAHEAGPGGHGSSDYPVTPYTPHRPSLTLGVALAGAAVADAAECFGQGGMTAVLPVVARAAACGPKRKQQ